MNEPTTGATHEVELFAEAMLAAVEDDIAAHDAAHDDASTDQTLPDAVLAVAAAIRRLGIDVVRRYHRLDLDTGAGAIDQPVLFVANHGFGGIFDVNLLAILAAFDGLQLTRPVTMLTHQVAWTLRVGQLLEPLGARPASPESAENAFRDGQHVLVLPGGDLDAFKSFADRDRIIFGGRRGFARLADDMTVPIVPIVTAGGAESALVLSDGTRLTGALRLDKLLRMKALPVSVSLPLGLSVGGAGMLPYLPLPTKLRTRVLPPMRRAPGETIKEYGDRVEHAMQGALTDMTTGRRPLLG